MKSRERSPGSSSEKGLKSPKKHYKSSPQKVLAPTANEFLDAAASGDLVIVQRYIDAHLHNQRTMNVTKPKGQSALALAAEAGHKAIVSALLDVATLEVNTEDNKEERPLYQAAYAGHQDIVTAILVAGGSIHPKWEKDVLKKVHELHPSICSILKWQEDRLTSLNHFIAECKLSLNRNTISAVLALSPKRYALFYAMTTNLLHTHNNHSLPMTNEIFIDTLQRVMHKFNRVHASNAVETREGSYYKYEVEGGPTIFANRQTIKVPELKGNKGSVCKGLLTIEDTIPTVAIKWVRKENDKDIPREAKYNNFLNASSPAIWFRVPQRGVGLVYPWRTGSALSDFTERKITAFPLALRLTCLTNFLSEISELHSKLRVHNDIKEANVVFNPLQEKLSLIDLGSARKIRTPFDYQSDMNQIYRLITNLFPDRAKGETNILKTAINKLLLGINPKSTRLDSCTSEQALRYCQSLLEHGRGLGETALEQIANGTIFCQTLSVDDVLRGRRFVSH